MNQTHIHLVITHLPIFGAILGGIVLLQGLWMKSHQTKLAAYTLFIISAIGAGIAYLTGEGAEEVVESIQGISDQAIDEHEDFAIYALISLLTLGAAALGGIYLIIKNSVYIRTMAIVTLCISVVSFGLVARTGYLGGQIRHTETSSVQQIPSQNAPEVQDKD